MSTAETPWMAALRPGRPSVLVVEDERLVARDIERSLEDIGYDVVASVASSEEAVSAAWSRRPDIVLMDVHIKGSMDGIDTADLLTKGLHVPVVYLSAFSDEETLARAARTAPYGYIVKPFAAADLKTALEVARYKHKLDARVEERERWFATTLSSIGDAVIACDSEERVLFMNPIAELLTGWHGGDALGSPVEEIARFVSEQGVPVEHPVRRALRERAVQSVPPSSRLVDRAGDTSRIVDDSAAPIISNDVLLGAVLVFRDVTRQRQLEEQMAVTDRLSSLGVLAASVGHEINNPLTYNIANLSYVIRGLARLAEGLGGPAAAQLDELRRALGEAHDGAERIAKIVADLKVFSGAEQQALRRIDVGACVDWALRVTGNQIGHSARVEKALERLPFVMANEVRLSQVFVNLLVNAAQAVRGRPEDNRIAVEGRTDESGAVVVEIHDTGPGISEEIRGKIFEPFFTTKEPGLGSGLGLSICRDIIGWLGGTLDLDRSHLGGSCFRVRLPAAEDQAAPERRVPTSGLVERRVRVLVVDDDVALGRTIHRILGGNDVTVVQSARHALALIREERPFDVILCDLMMPDMSGQDFYVELVRSRPDLVRRVAFMTGGAFSTRTVDFLQDVRPRCLTKPFSADSLSRFIAECAAPAAGDPAQRLLYGFSKSESFE